MCFAIIKDDAKKKEVLNSLELNDKKLEHYSKARPLFKLDDEEKKKAFGKSVNRAVKLIEEIKDLEETKEELSFLKIIQDNVLFEDELVKERSEKPPKSIKTLTDKDAKLAHKNKEDLLFGYKQNISITEFGAQRALGLLVAFVVLIVASMPILNQLGIIGFSMGINLLFYYILLTI